MLFIGVEVEQETSAPPPKKNPGSAPEKLPGSKHKDFGFAGINQQLIWVAPLGNMAEVSSDIFKRKETCQSIIIIHIPLYGLAHWWMDIQTGYFMNWIKDRQTKCSMDWPYGGKYEKDTV